MKRLFLFLPILILSFLFVSCASKPSPSKKAGSKSATLKTKPKMIMSLKDPPDVCIPMTLLKGTYIGLKPNTRESLKEIRIKAEKIEANYVRIDGSTEGGTTIHGMAFKCP